MAVIFSYPIKSTPDNDDLILISDGTDRLTKQVRVSSLPGGSSSGVASLNTLTQAVTITGGTNVTLNTVGNNIEINAAGGGGTPSAPLNSVQFNNNSAFGGSANLTFATDTLRVTHTLDVRGDGTNAGKLKLYCENTSTPHAVTIEGPAHLNATAYTLKLPSAAPANNQVLQYTTSGNLGWINTPASTAPQGDDGQFQYKNGSSFAGSDTLRFDADKIHIGKGGVSPTRGQLVMYGDGSNTSDIQLYNSANTRFLKLAQQAGATQDLTLTFPGQGSGGNNKILESDSSGQLSWIDTPTGTTYSAGTGLALNGTTFSLASNAALTNLGGGTGTTFLRKDGTWASPSTSNTNIANSNLQLDSNRTLDFGNGETISYSLDIINTQTAGVKNLFKFDQIGGTSPRFTVGHTASAYEGNIDLKGNGSNRTGVLKFENSAGTYYTSFQAPNTFAVSNNINYVLPNQQGSADSVLTNNGSGTLSWGSVAVVEEGTWTPSAYVAVGSVPTVATAVGSYIKIGDLVNCYFYLNVTSSSSANVPMIIGGLPFSASNTNGYRGTASISRNDGNNYIQQQATSGLVTGNQLSLKRPDIQATNPSGTTVSITNTETINAGWYATATLNYVLEGTIIFKV